MDTTITRQIERIAGLLQHAQYPVAFTGAGISTASGIPDFRDPTNGLWQHDDPMKVASLAGFRADPSQFFRWVRPLVNIVTSAKPNAAHRALAQLQNMDKLAAIITQNIDGLHTLAGNAPIFELHGHLRTVTCTHCFTTYDATPYLADFSLTGSIPRCDCHTDGILKPDVILFGEQLPHKAVTLANRAIQHADLLLVLGSSLQVYPANQIPMKATQSGAKLVIVNYDPTPADRYADVLIHEDVNQIMPLIVNAMEENS